MNSSEFQAQTEKIERLVQSVSAFADEEARNTALELLQSLMDLHGAALSRIVELLSDSGEKGRASLTKLGEDPLICGLLVLYGAHPVALEQRVAKALDKARLQLQKQGGSVELIGLNEAEAVVRVKIQSSGQGCGSSPDALKKMVDQSILEAAPEVVEVIAEGLPGVASGFVPLNKIQPATKEEKKYEESAV
jgi:Fe-S cluster biogenesis protein NfuA